MCLPEWKKQSRRGKLSDEALTKVLKQPSQKLEDLDEGSLYSNSVTHSLCVQTGKTLKCGMDDPTIMMVSIPAFQQSFLTIFGC